MTASPCSGARSSTALTNDAKNTSSIESTTMPIVLPEPDFSERAAEFGTWPSSITAASTRARSFGKHRVHAVDDAWTRS